MEDVMATSAGTERHDAFREMQIERYAWAKSVDGEAVEQFEANLRP